MKKTFGQNLDKFGRIWTKFIFHKTPGDFQNFHPKIGNSAIKSILGPPESIPMILTHKDNQK